MLLEVVLLAMTNATTTEDVLCRSSHCWCTATNSSCSVSVDVARGPVMEGGETRGREAR